MKLFLWNLAGILMISCFFYFVGWLLAAFIFLEWPDPFDWEGRCAFVLVFTFWTILAIRSPIYKEGDL